VKDEIDRLITLLREEGIEGLADYEQRLVNNAGNVDVFTDLVFESSAALMFSRHGFKVTIREKPDLRVELDDEVIYAEVKHFREKEQDRIDEKAMRESEDLVPVGNTVLLEGIAARQQIANIAARKASQYMANAPNLLVIASDSNCIAGIILSTAVNIYDEKVSESNDLCLRRLNGFMLMDQWIWPGDRLEQLIGAGSRSVIFRPTACAAIPLSAKLTNALESIRNWQHIVCKAC
jgi:hypothetical protein